MNILCLETSTEACSVALLTDQKVFSEFSLAPRRHTELLPKMLDGVFTVSQLAREQVTYIAYASGPGAFTGIRIAAAFAQGIALGLNVPLIAVSSLAVLAQTAFDTFKIDRCHAVLDARMGECYWGYFRCDSQGIAWLDGSESLVSEQQLIKVAQNKPKEEWAGNGARLLLKNESVMTQKCYADLLPDAASLAKIARAYALQGKVNPADKVEINYLRNKVAEKKVVTPM